MIGKLEIIDDFFFFQKEEEKKKNSKSNAVSTVNKYVDIPVK